MCRPVSLLAIFQIFSSDQIKSIEAPIKIILCILSLIITISLFLYELRNSELYRDLGSRARRIESELNLSTGQFLGRLNPHGIIDHTISINLIYVSSIVA